MSATDAAKPSVVIVGGGFAGVGCAKELAKHGVAVTLLDRRNYHQFQPLLYQVATAELATADIARPLRAIFGKDRDGCGEGARGDGGRPRQPDASPRLTARPSPADYLVLAAGSRPNFFHTSGAEQHSFPLYTVDDAKALRNRLFEVFEEADTNPLRNRRGCAEHRHRRRRAHGRRDRGRRSPTS